MVGYLVKLCLVFISAVLTGEVYGVFRFYVETNTAKVSLEAENALAAFVALVYLGRG